MPPADAVRVASTPTIRVCARGGVGTLVCPLHGAGSRRGGGGRLERRRPPPLARGAHLEPWIIMFAMANWWFTHTLQCGFMFNQ
eukprot:4499773-Prymnesium_polylepis.1